MRRSDDGESGDDEALASAMRGFVEDVGADAARNVASRVESGLSDAAEREFDREVMLEEDVGPYRPRELLGSGGMGVVYLAEQQEPVRRLVALKLIKPGMDSRTVISRFEAERQALALMDHPCIAHVYDAGTTSRGHPYFVMEYVPGISLNEYCDQQQLSISERLELFIRICEAVQHAHQKGIIHRDLKPSNVLVIELDGEPLPKVIDFGLAKATEGSLNERSLQTLRGMPLGTPEYMSPEQAGFSARDVDTRSDIYSLGVILYEMLTGGFPFDEEVLKRSSADEILRLICEKDPRRPSSRLSGASGDAAARLRRSEPERLRRALSGDLDWITLKALEKDRSRRYATASELAEDVRRHLRSEPVSASPPSVVYRIGKMVKRHKGAVVAAFAVLLALVVGLVVSSWQYIQADRARLEARESAESAKDLYDYLASILLSEIRHEYEQPNVTILDIVRREAPALDGRFESRPWVEASIRGLFGWVLSQGGAEEEAVEQYQLALARHAAIGLDDGTEEVRDEAAENLLVITNRLSLVLLDLGRAVEAETVISTVLSDPSKQLSVRTRAGLTRILGLALMRQERWSEAEEVLLELSEECARSEPLESFGLQLLTDLAKAAADRGDRALARERLGELVHHIQSGRITPRRLGSIRGEMGAVYLRLGDYKHAESELLRSYDLLEPTLNNHNLMTQQTVLNLVSLYEAWDRDEQAEEWRGRVSRPTPDQPSNRNP